MTLTDVVNKIKTLPYRYGSNRLCKHINALAGWLTRRGCSADGVTFAGLLFAVLGLNFLAMGHYFSGLLCVLGNRLCDILDGQIAGIKGITRFGAFIDIFADYTAFAMFIWGFVLANPTDNAASGAFMLVVLAISAASFLGYSAVSGINLRRIGQSRLTMCIWGTIQNADYTLALILMCLLPGIFNALAVTFALISAGKILLLLSSAYYTMVVAKKGSGRHDNP